MREFGGRKGEGKMLLSYISKELKVENDIHTYIYTHVCVCVCVLNLDEGVHTSNLNTHIYLRYENLRLHTKCK